MVAKKIIVFFSILLLGNIFVFSANTQDSLIQGLEAYKNGDWSSASFFLRKAVTSPENSSDNVWYMIIASQMYAENYETAVSDCDTFKRKFADSPLVPYVEYQKGRALHFLGQNDSAVLTLSGFCHQYPKNEMYSSALYWLGECFFDDFNYESAKSLYETIVADFPDSSKVQDAKFKLDLIAQREREQKLLYLLKMTGEEYLNSRENYEKQIREYQTQDLVSLRRQLNAANSRIKELEDAASETLNAVKLRSQNEAKQNVLSSQENLEDSSQQALPLQQASSSRKKAVSDEEMSMLKAKAELLQAILDKSTETK